MRKISDNEKIKKIDQEISSNMANIDEENCYNAILVCFLLDFYDKISYFRFTNENVQVIIRFLL